MKSLSMKNFFGITWLLPHCAGALSAQQEKPGRRFPSQTAPVQAQEPERIELKNGIVIFFRRHELPFVSGSVLIPAARAMRTRPGRAWWVSTARRGYSGTAKWTATRWTTCLRRRRRTLRRGREDSTVLAWDSLKGDADQVFSLAMDLLFHQIVSRSSRWPAAEATGIVRRNDDESGSRTANRPSWSTAPTALYREPELSTIGAVTVDDLKAWHNRTIHGRLIIASAATSTQRRRKPAAPAFEALPPVVPSRAARCLAGPTPGVTSFKERRKSSNVQIVDWVGPSHPDWPHCRDERDPGGGFAASVSEIRTELGLAYEVAAASALPMIIQAASAVALTRAPYR